MSIGRGSAYQRSGQTDPGIIAPTQSHYRTGEDPINRIDRLIFIQCGQIDSGHEFVCVSNYGFIRQKREW
jgi:hypothetical protein